MDYFKTFTEVIKNKEFQSIAGKALSAIGKSKKAPSVANAAPPNAIPANVPAAVAIDAVKKAPRTGLYVALGIAGAGLLIVAVAVLRK